MSLLLGVCFISSFRLALKKLCYWRWQINNLYIKYPQNYVLKVIFEKSKFHPTISLFSETILNMRCLYILIISKFMMKINNLHLSHNLNTRNKQRGNSTFSNSKTTLNLNLLDPKMYNLLPPLIRLMKTTRLSNKNALIIFKKMMLMYIRNTFRLYIFSITVMCLWLQCFVL